MRRISSIVALVVLWVLLWGEVNAANVLSGIVVATGVVLVFPTGDRHRRTIVRPLPTLRLVGVVARELLVSNVSLSRDVLSRNPRLSPGLVACPLACAAPWIGGLVANLLALSPGTMPVDVDLESYVLHVHVLRSDDPAATQRYVARIEALVVRAFGSTRDLEALAAAQGAA